MKEIQRDAFQATFKCEVCGHREVVNEAEKDPKCSQCAKKKSPKVIEKIIPKKVKK